MSSNSSALKFIEKEFCEAFATVFEQTAGEPYLLIPGETTSSGSRPDELGFTLDYTGRIAGSMFVLVDTSSAAVLAQRLMGEDVDSNTTFLPEHEDALSEIVNQTAGVVANSLRTQFGAAEIQVGRKQSPEAMPSIVITLLSAGTDAVSIRLFPDQRLVDALLSALSGPAPSTAPSPSAQPEVDASSEQQNLRLIMDVELDLTLRFGQKTLPLSEVADLATGSVIELDRVVDEPVELLLGERVIARGEVVIVDGNYGLRITELASIDKSSLLSA